MQTLIKKSLHLSILLLQFSAFAGDPSNLSANLRTIYDSQSAILAQLDSENSIARQYNQIQAERRLKIINNALDTMSEFKPSVTEDDTHKLKLLNDLNTINVKLLAVVIEDLEMLKDHPSEQVRRLTLNLRNKYKNAARFINFDADQNVKDTVSQKNLVDLTGSTLQILSRCEAPAQVNIKKTALESELQSHILKKTELEKRLELAKKASSDPIYFYEHFDLPRMEKQLSESLKKHALLKTEMLDANEELAKLAIKTAPEFVAHIEKAFVQSSKAEAGPLSGALIAGNYLAYLNENPNDGYYANVMRKQAAEVAGTTIKFKLSQIDAYPYFAENKITENGKVRLGFYDHIFGKTDATLDHSKLDLAAIAAFEEKLIREQRADLSGLASSKSKIFGMNQEIHYSLIRLRAKNQELEQLKSELKAHAEGRQVSLVIGREDLKLIEDQKKEILGEIAATQKQIDANFARIQRLNECLLRYDHAEKKLKQLDVVNPSVELIQQGHEDLKAFEELSQ